MVEFPCFLKWFGAVILVLAALGNCIAFIAGFMYAPVEFLPNYAATIFGISNSFTGVNGLITPNLVAYLTPSVSDR